jgi:ATP-dependent Lon protease
MRLIDIISGRLDARTDSYLATLPSLRLSDVRIADKLVQQQERMLTGGFYAEVELGYDAAIARKKAGRPFEVTGLHEIQLSSRDILDKIAAGRAQLSTAEWKDLLLRSARVDELDPRAPGAIRIRSEER